MWPRHEVLTSRLLCDLVGGSGSLLATGDVHLGLSKQGQESSFGGVAVIIGILGDLA